MVIQVGNIVLNNTKRFLSPCLRKYGNEFIERLNSVFKIGMGIGDIILIENGVLYEQHIFILIDTKQAVNHFKVFIDWIKNQDMYEDDYVYDNINSGQYHMVVIKLPIDCYGPLEKLKHSQFSKMFTKEEVDEYFKDKPAEKAILIKDNQYKIEYTDKLNKMFGTRIHHTELEGELEFPIEKGKEIFNNHLKTKSK